MSEKKWEELLKSNKKFDITKKLEDKIDERVKKYVNKISFIYLQTNFLANDITQQIYTCSSALWSLKYELGSLRESGINDEFVLLSFKHSMKRYDWYDIELFEKKIICVEVNGSDINLYINAKLLLNYIFNKGYKQYTKLSSLTVVINPLKELPNGLKKATHFALATLLQKIIKDDFLDSLVEIVKVEKIKKIVNNYAENVVEVEFIIEKNIIYIKLNTLLIIRDAILTSFLIDYIKEKKGNKIIDETIANSFRQINKENDLDIFLAVEGLYLLLDISAKAYLQKF